MSLDAVEKVSLLQSGSSGYLQKQLMDPEQQLYTPSCHHPDHMLYSGESINLDLKKILIL